MDSDNYINTAGGFYEILFVGILSCIHIFHIKKPVHKKTAEIFSTFLLGAYLPVLKEHFVFSISHKSIGNRAWI